MIVRVYYRCNSGHYFAGSHCPIDGWSSPASTAIAAVSERSQKEGAQPSIDALRALGVSAEALRRCIVMEFGDAEAAFEAIAPEGYVIGGKWLPIKDFDGRYI